MTHLELVDATVKFGALVALNGVTLQTYGPAKLGLIGPNGAGKTTLLSAITGFVPLSDGSVTLDGEDITGFDVQKRVARGVMRSFQTARLLEDEDVRTNVLLGCNPIGGPGSIRQLFGTIGYRRWNKQAQFRANEVEELFGISSISHVRVSELPSAQRRFVELARILVSRPKVLLLDEPAAGLDHGERRQLEAVLHRIAEDYSTLLILVEHDVMVVRNVCDYTFVLSEGALLTQGPTDQVLNEPAVVDAYFGGAAHA
jgi:branched-chain amino acid transport system ATP-binding protein